MAGYRDLNTKSINDGNIDYEKMLKDIPSRYSDVVKANFKHIEKYGKENGLTQKQVEDLKKMEVIVARTYYLNERNEQARRSNDALAKRDIARNEAELAALEAQYNKMSNRLGRHANDINDYIDKQNTKKSTR